MYSHVLIPVQLDNSRDIDKASAAARTLVDSGGQVTFLHVMEPLSQSFL